MGVIVEATRVHTGNSACIPGKSIVANLCIAVSQSLTILRAPTILGFELKDLLLRLVLEWVFLVLLTVAAMELALVTATLAETPAPPVGYRSGWASAQMLDPPVPADPEIRKPAIHPSNSTFGG